MSQLNKCRIVDTFHRNCDLIPAGCVVKCALPGHTDHVRALDFSHDDSFLLSGSADETVMIWQMDEPTADPQVS